MQAISSSLAARISPEEFEAFVQAPENSERLFEYIGGEIVEVPSNAYASSISAQIIYLILHHVKSHGIAGYVTGEAGGYVVNGERYAPDVAFISKDRQPELAQAGYNPNPPDFAVEVDFPPSGVTQRSLRLKLSNYLAAGTTVWIVMPDLRQVEVHVPGQAPRVYGEGESIALGGPLAGLVIAVDDIFPPAKAQA